MYAAAMSRAFVKETPESAPPPERMVEDGPNLVTPEGLAQIEGHVARLEAALASETNPLLRETLARDLRYWVHQRATAEVVARALPASRTSPVNGGGKDSAGDETGTEEISFGSSVVIKRKNREQRFRIVGVDEFEATAENDPSRGLISFRSPLAAALIGARKGEVIEAQPPLGEIEIVAVEN
jgi:Transcription elongation factor, GreA/GreB, C-term